ncbi:hypothetical protein OSB04_011662 [Centaurea solstitialis]|uniref:Reverse transcriptase domain-containing protein n=1 Tax=Centaurea solstitialis TaxID=347529 RepID=A0AA38TUK9_9ASTR|nr:hypothetical protein OSB04_011662 [Centaurea solstitialis]
MELQKQVVTHLGDDDPTMVVTDCDLSDDDGKDVADVVDSVSDKNNRTSVFDRLTVDDRLKLGEKEMNFAKAVGGKDTTTLSFFPLANKSQSSIRIPESLAKEVMKTHRATLYGYFLGPRLHFPVVEKFVKAAWGKFGFCEAMMNSNGIYFFKFNDFGGSNQVVEAGPLMIRGVPLFVEHWDPVKGLVKPIHNSCPLWVKLHNIPLVAFNKEGISRIASALGIPKQMDACTASMCDKSWGRPGFAKVLIETWAVGELKRELQVIIPSLHGGDDVHVSVRVEYLWEPTQCSHCMVFGHKTSTCVKAVVAQKKKDKAPMVDVDGFTVVKRKEWRPKPLQIVEGSTSGTKEGNAKDVGKDNVGMTVEETPIDDVLPKDTGKNAQDDDRMAAKESTDGLTNLLDKLHASLEEVGHKETTKSTELVEPKLKEVVHEADGWKSSPTRPPPVTVIPKAPIKGILKNPNRFAALAGQSEIRKETKEEAILKRKSSEDKGESHVHVDALKDVCDRTFGRWSWYSNQMHCMHGTRIIVAWDLRKVDVVLLEMNDQVLHCEVRLHGVPDPFLCSFVYGANQRTTRRILWSSLRKFKVLQGQKPWVLLGDFNSMLFPHDGFGGVSRRNSDMMEFGDCIEDVEIFDINYTGIQYTWCQKPAIEGGVLRKLDRVLANTEFTTRFHDASVRFLARGLSDHAPSVLSFTGGTRKWISGFKFDNFLVNDPSFFKIVHEGWTEPVEGNFMFVVLKKLKGLKSPFRKLRSTYHNLSKRCSSLKVELEVIQIACDLDPSNTSLQEDLRILRVAYQQACRNEEVAAKQRAKIKWLAEGDSNTRFFHQVVKEKRHVQHVHSVANTEGVFVFGQDVPLAFTQHLKCYLGEEDESVNPTMHNDLFTSRLSLTDALHMIRPISDDEIRQALFQIGNNKAPGSDGFSAKFFKKAWDIIGKDIMVAIHNFFYRGHLVRELNHTLLCLLPKSVNASSVSEFRPISCCSVLYKCISKVVVGRMKDYLDSLVGKYQSAFIPGRSIVDNIMMAHELVVGYQKEQGPPRCAFKIDIRKAYDMVNWRYLINILKGFGFHPVMIKWIEEMVTTPSFSVSLNGETHGFFHGKRGIRQGDPLSPYLFTLVMEGFSLIFKQCIEEAGNFGYHKGCETLQITHLCFADDLFVFTYGDVLSVEVLKKALDIFALRSGLHANLDKSDIFFGNVPTDTRNAIRACLPFRCGTFPIRYLGVPLSPVRLRMPEYGVLVMRLKSRIQNWKMKYLSFGGKRQLIISVLHSLQLYWMAIFCFPAAVLLEIERVIRDFLWSNGESSKGRNRVAWSDVCTPLRAGGLGFKNLAVWNKALLAKHVWNLASKRESLWVSWVNQTALRNSHFWAARKSSRWSWVLSKIMVLRPLFREFIKTQLGDGNDTHAWEDYWLLCGPLSSFISARFIHSSGLNLFCTVAGLVQKIGNSWPIQWTQRYACLTNNPIPTLSLQVKDSLYWEVVGRNFSIKVAKRHPTQDRMLSWKEVPPDMKCSLCLEVGDSHSHLFFQCRFAHEIWTRILDAVDWLDFPNDWDDILAALDDDARKPKKMIHRLALSACVYNIWKERNKRLFTDHKRNTQQIVKSVLETIRLREAWKMRKKRDVLIHGDS